MIAAAPFGPIPAAPAQPCCGALVRLPCACGTRVKASRHDPAPGVAAHNRTVWHQSWWASVRDDWQGEERP